MWNYILGILSFEIQYIEIYEKWEKKMILEKSFKDKDSAIITASADIEYQVIIDVIDAIQLYTDDEENIQPLFPQVNFGKVL